MAYSMDRHGNWHQQAGNDFEDDMADAFMYRLTKAVNKCDIKWKRTVIETRDKYPYLDQFQGTDIVINVREEKRTDKTVKVAEPAHRRHDELRREEPHACLQRDRHQHRRQSHNDWHPLREQPCGLREARRSTWHEHERT